MAELIKGFLTEELEPYGADSILPTKGLPVFSC